MVGDQGFGDIADLGNLFQIGFLVALFVKQSGGCLKDVFFLIFHKLLFHVEIFLVSDLKINRLFSVAVTNRLVDNKMSVKWIKKDVRSNDVPLNASQRIECHCQSPERAFFDGQKKYRLA